MNAIGSLDPLGRPLTPTALVVAIVTMLVTFAGSAWASSSGSERAFVDTCESSTAVPMALPSATTAAGSVSGDRATAAPPATIGCSVVRFFTVRLTASVSDVGP
jgi:hypothetical protein